MMSWLLKVMIAFVAPKKRKPTTPAIDVKINCPVFAQSTPSLVVQIRLRTSQFLSYDDGT
jgi:hypothetical protein